MRPSPGSRELGRRHWRGRQPLAWAAQRRAPPSLLWQQLTGGARPVPRHRSTNFFVVRKGEVWAPTTKYQVQPPPARTWRGSWACPWSPCCCSRSCRVPASGLPDPLKPLAQLSPGSCPGCRASPAPACSASTSGRHETGMPLSPTLLQPTASCAPARRASSPSDAHWQISAAHASPCCSCTASPAPTCCASAPGTASPPGSWTSA